VRLETEVGTVKTQVRSVSADVAALKVDINILKEGAVEHRMRLENGSNVFSAMRKDLDEVDKRTRPRPPSIIKIVGLTLALFTTAAGSLWMLANMLRDRPTVEQLEGVLKKYDAAHEAGGHKDLRGDVHEIQREQAIQGKAISNVVEQQAHDTKKLDTVLERLPPRPRRRR